MERINEKKCPKCNRPIVLIIMITILILSLIIWAPWITNEYALNKVKINNNFIKQHPEGIKDSEIDIFWLPFGKAVTTYEGLWYVPFFGFVI